jgi:hypothetical protein
MSAPPPGGILRLRLTDNAATRQTFNRSVMRCRKSPPEFVSHRGSFSLPPLPARANMYVVLVNAAKEPRTPLPTRRHRVAVVIASADGNAKRVADPDEVIHRGRRKPDSHKVPPVRP